MKENHPTIEGVFKMVVYDPSQSDYMKDHARDVQEKNAFLLCYELISGTSPLKKNIVKVDVFSDMCFATRASHRKITSKSHDFKIKCVKVNQWRKLVFSNGNQPKPQHLCWFLWSFHRSWQILPNSQTFMTFSVKIMAPGIVPGLAWDSSQPSPWSWDNGVLHPFMTPSFGEIGNLE